MNEQDTINPPDVITIRIGETTRDIVPPKSWDDLDKRQALLYYDLLFSTSNKGMQADAFTALKLISITEDILGVTTGFMMQWEADCIAEDAEYGDFTFLEEMKQVMVRALSGLFETVEDEDGGNRWSVKFNRTKNIWPALTEPSKRGVTWYFAPKDGLANLTLYEMALTFTKYEAFVRTGDERLANELIAILYRPSRPVTQAEKDTAWKGDRRMPLRHAEGKIAERARLAASLPLLTRRMIVFWFASCRESIIARYPKVFVRSEEAPTGGYGWSGVLLGIAGGPTGLDSVADQHYSNALTWLSMKEDERREMEKELEKVKGRKRG